MRELFLSLLIEKIDKNLITSELLSKNKYYQLVNKIKQIKDKQLKNYNDVLLLSKYDVIVEDNVERLVMPSIVNRHNKYYVYEEELFDVINEIHLNLNHAKLRVLFDALCKKYVNISFEIVKFFLSLCHTCSSQCSIIKDLNRFQSNPEQLHSKWRDEDLSDSLKSAPSKLTEISDIPIIDISDDNDGINDVEVNRKILCQNHTNILDDNEVIVEAEEDVLVVEEVSNGSGNDFLNPVLPSESPNFSNVSKSPSENPNKESNAIQKDRNLSQSIDESFMSIDDAVHENDDIEIVEPTEVRLRWNLYDHNMKLILSNFFRDEEFVDVSLVCENKTIKCHKVILAASSPHFEDLFKKRRHPVIVLEDIYFWQIKALIKFIYTGEIKIPHDKLESLLDAASSLQIKGLAQSVANKMVMKNISSCKKNCDAKFKDEKKFAIKNNISNLNKKVLPHKKLVAKSEIGIQTAPVIISDSNNSNLCSSPNTPQISDSIPNTYRVFAQAYIPVTGPTNCQNFIPLGHSPNNVASFSIPQVTFPSISESILTRPSIPMLYNAIPTVSSQTTNLAPQMNSAKPDRYFTVSCCSSTQTSPFRDNCSDVENDESTSISREINFNNKNLNDKPTKKRKPVRPKVRDESRRIEINSMISNGETSIIFTRNKAADLQSIAERTRKKQSAKKKKTSKYSDLYNE